MVRRCFMPTRIIILLCGCLLCIICTITLSLTCSCEEQFSLSRLHSFAASSLHGQKDQIVFRYAFPIGTKNLSLLLKEQLKEESNSFNDLIFLKDLTDTYQNLTKKSLLSMEALHNMYKFEFLLKVDSDSFVRLGAFLKALKDIADPNLYWGFLDGRARPKRRGQWTERDWIICDRYVPYQLGGGYVLSYKLVDFLVRNKDLLKIYKNEDVSVGAWLAGLSVRYVHDPRFDTEFRSRGCNNQYIITHKQTPESLKKLYASVINTGKLCEKEYRTRPSYVYDWSVPPIQNAQLENPNSVYNGTSQTELLLWQLIGPFSILLRNIAVPWIFVGFRFALSNGFWLKFALDFLFIIFNQMIDDQHSPTKFITYMRSMGLIATATAILSVDFDIFPRRFAKTYTYGRSVMDLGTATFVYCFAIVDVFKDFPSTDKFPSIRKRHFFRKHSSSIILLCMGFGRTCMLQLLNYPIQVTEYGVHWNFFITLAFLRIIVKLLGRRYHLLFGIIIVSVYQYLLGERNLQNWVLSDTVNRDTFITMNREGIFSLFGYLSIYYFASAIASFMYSTGIRLKSWFCRTFQLFMIAALLFFAQKLAEILMGPPSRRIANLSYILEMLVFHTICMAGFLLIQLASIFGWAAQMPQFSIDEGPFERLKPCMLDSVNRYEELFNSILKWGCNIDKIDLAINHTRLLSFVESVPLTLYS
ncbi:Beta-1,3-galactosyltransferase sqv-2 [Dirofilaria immitis]